MSLNQVSLSAQNQYINKSGVDDSHTAVDTILEPVEQTVVNSVAPARRIAGIPDMLKNGDTFGAVGIAALTLVNLPEDCRDLKAAYKHSACALTRKNIPKAYDYKKYQHDFSFFRGTLLHEWLKKIKSVKGKRVVNRLYNADKTLYNTKSAVNSLLSTNGGTQLTNNWYWSSTGAAYYYVVNMSNGSEDQHLSHTNRGYSVRPVLAF